MPEEVVRLEYPATMKVVSKDGGKSFLLVIEAKDEKGCRVVSMSVPLGEPAADPGLQERKLNPAEPKEADPGLQEKPNQGEGVAAGAVTPGGAPLGGAPLGGDQAGPPVTGAETKVEK